LRDDELAVENSSLYGVSGN